MVKRAIRWLAALTLLAGAAGWWLSRPLPPPGDFLAGLSGDATRGEAVFWAAGCASCHIAPGAPETDRPVLSGGLRLPSPFGTFIAPNITPSPAGIGGWSAEDLAAALIAGVSPEGAHYYPAFPYTTYQRMRAQDVIDLKAFLDRLPESQVASLPHEVAFPFNIRRGLGLWKRLNLAPGWVMADPATPELQRGRYLVEALGHCAECHTPRDLTGALDAARWMRGAPNPTGKGRIPAIHPADLDWSATDIAYYLETGFTPDYDSAGGHMARVVANTARLVPDDRAAIAAYVKALR